MDKLSKMTSAEEEMTEKTAPSTQDEEELVEKEDNSIEIDREEEEGLDKKEEQGGKDDDEDGVNQVVKEDNAIETNGEELLEKQEEAGEDVEEVEQEVNKKVEAHTTVSGSTDNAETKTASSKKQKEKEQKLKKGEAVLNVNNQVVKMRTEVKRVRALLIRKLLRHLADLKKKKGKETDLERNQRRADRLLEEIRQMKRLRPDQVTKTALVNEFNFEKVCKDPTTTMSQRAMARIATHPQFSKKIDVIKAAVKAFDEERKKERQKQKMTPFQEEEEQDALRQKEEEDEEETEDEEAEDEDEDATIGGLSDPGTETAPVDEMTETSDQIRSEILARSKTVAVSKSVKMSSTKNTEIKDILKETLQGKPTAMKAPEKKQNPKPAPKMQPSNKDEEEEDDGDEEEQEQEDVEEKQSNDDDEEDKGSGEEEKESDLESSDEEEREYFDDSTEERFRKQSEGSESEDDFFVGKVSKKKKKKAHAIPSLKSQTSEDSQTEKKLKKPKSELNYKAPKLASIFCSTLSSSQPGAGGLSRDRGRGRGGDRGRGRGGDRGRGRGRDRGRGRGGDRGGGTDRFTKSPSKFQKQDGGARGKPGFKNSEHGSEAKQFQSEDKDRTFTGRGIGRGRGGVARQQEHRGPGGFSHQAPQQALHPSWEASKKRKEQQGIMAFQGKKIKFGDDD